MRRRQFITLLGGAAAAWPLAARAQQAYRLGILTGRSRDEPNFVAFFEELRQAGIVEGQQLTVDPRGFSTREDRYPALAVELVASEPMQCWPQAMRRYLRHKPPRGLSLPWGFLMTW
jgi:putative tryptophan/tyrosine transport system substrate-binding protein